jgi:hypothetical protein
VFKKGDGAQVMDSAAFSFVGARYHHGWLYAFDIDFNCIARPDARSGPVPSGAEHMVRRGIANWARNSQEELLMVVAPTLTVRVFDLQGPAGTCVIALLEQLVTRVEE